VTEPLPSFATFFGNVSAALVQIAPSKRGADAPGKHGNPPRYVWIWLSTREADAILPNRGNPEPIGEDWHAFEVHCWAKTDAQLEALRASLIAAIRRDVGPARYVIGEAQISDSDAQTKGFLLVQAMEVRLPMFEVLLPTSAPATFPTVELETATPDPTGATAGDGVLQEGET
jgi:hypothetical protein